MRKPSIRIATVAAVGALAVGGFGLSQASAENDPNTGGTALSGTVATVEDPDITLDANLDDLVDDQDTQVAAIRKLLEEATSAIADIRNQALTEARAEARTTVRAEAEKVARAEVAKIRQQVADEIAEIRKELAAQKEALANVNVNADPDAADTLAEARAEWQRAREQAIAAFREQVRQFLQARQEARENARDQFEQARNDRKAALEQARAERKAAMERAKAERKAAQEQAKAEREAAKAQARNAGFDRDNRDGWRGGDNDRRGHGWGWGHGNR